MKVIFEFTLPEQHKEMETASKAGEMFSTLLEIDRILQSCLDHGGDPQRAMEACRHAINETIYPLL